LSGEDETRRHGRCRRFARIGAIAIAAGWLIAIAAVGSAVLALLYGWQPDRLRAGLEWAAVHLIDHTLRIDRLEGSLLEGLTLHGVAIRPVVDDGDEADTLRIRRIALRIDASASLRRRALVLAEVVVVNPTIALSRSDEEGRLHLAGWGPLGDTGDGGDPRRLPFAILVGAIQVSDAHLSLPRDARSGLEDIRARADVDGNGLRIHGASQVDWPNEASLRVQLRSAGWRGIDLGTGSLAIRLQGSALRVESLELAGPVGNAALSGTIDFAGRLDEPRARHGTLRAHLEEVDVSAIALRGRSEDETTWSRLNGDVDVSIDRRAGAHATGFELGLDAVLSRSTVLGGPIEGADLSATYRTGVRRWRLAESTIELPAGTVRLSGEGESLDVEALDATADDVDLASLPAHWTRGARLGGRADLAASLRGALADPRGEVEASARALTVDGFGPGELELAVRSRGGGRYTLDALEGSFAPGAGRLAGVEVRTLGAATLEVGAGTVAVEDLALDWTGGSMLIDGGVRRDALLPTHIEVDALDLGVVARMLALADEPAGVVSGSVRASGPLTDPDLTAELDWRDPAYRGLRADHVAVALAGDADARELDARITQDGREQLALSARLPRPLDAGDPRRWLTDRHTALDLDARSLDLGWLSPLLRTATLDSTGRLDGRLSFTGAEAGPTAYGSLTVEAARIDRTATPGTERHAVVGPIDGTVVFSGQQARIEGLRYGAGETELAVDGTLAWKGPLARHIDLSATLTGVGFTGRAALDLALREDGLEPSVLTFTDFEVAELTRRAGLIGRFGGTLTGEIVVRGPLDVPIFRTRLAWQDPRLAGGRGDRLFVEAHSDEETVALRGGLERSGKQVLDAAGFLALDRSAPLGAWVEQLRLSPARPATRLDLSFDGFPLDWLPALAPGLPLRISGFVEGQLTLRGGEPVPRVDGVLRVDRGVFALATQAASVGPLEGTIHLLGQHARFDRLALSATRGGAVLGGEVHWDETGVERVSVRAHFQDYRFDQLGLLRATIDGDLQASGPLQSLHVGGDLRLDGIRIAFPDTEDPVLKEIRVLGLPEDDAVSIREGEGRVPGIQERSTVDVTVTLPRGTWVRGIGLDAEVVGEVHITKEAGESPRYVGRMEVEYGRYALQGKRFQLDRGVAVFTGGPSPVPEIDIEAHREASRDVTIYANVTGPADSPTLELTSDPPMDTAEIISYLFFGRSTTVGDREGRGLGASAASVAGSLLIDSIAPELRDTLRIDEISVTSDETDGAPAVEIETQVTPDVYLRLIQSLGASADEAVEVRWRFWRGLSLKSRVSRSGLSAVDMLWEVDFWGLEDYGLAGLSPPPPPYRADAPVPVPCRPPLTCPTD